MAPLPATIVGKSVAVSQLRGITREEFALSHPGGALGRRLLLKVRDVMHRGAEVPLVREEETLSAAILEIVRKRLGMTAVVNDAGRLTGIITDGDLKRILVRHRNAMDLPVRDLMTREPRTIGGDVPLERALLRMEENAERLITSLLIVNSAGEPEGVIHMHDILRAGVG